MLTCYCFDCCQLPINTYGMLIRPQSLPLQETFQTLHHKCLYFHKGSCAICICILHGESGGSRHGAQSSDLSLVAATCESMDSKYLEIMCSSCHLDQWGYCGVLIEFNKSEKRLKCILHPDYDALKLCNLTCLINYSHQINSFLQDPQGSKNVKSMYRSNLTCNTTENQTNVFIL